MKHHPLLLECRDHQELCEMEADWATVPVLVASARQSLTEAHVTPEPFAFSGVKKSKFQMTYTAQRRCCQRGLAHRDYGFRCGWPVAAIAPVVSIRKGVHTRCAILGLLKLPHRSLGAGWMFRYCAQPSAIGTDAIMEGCQHVSARNFIQCPPLQLPHVMNTAKVRGWKALGTG
jgi:hypothetical protein